MADICEQYLAARIAEGVKAPQGIRWALKPILDHFGGLAPNDVNAPYQRGYMLKRRREGRAEPTIGKELRTLRAAMRWAEREGIIDRAPLITAPGENAARDRWITKHEFASLVDEATVVHVRAFLHLAAYTGARKAQILSLQWPQIDFDGNLVLFRRSLPGETKRISPKPMHPVLRDELEQARLFARTNHVIEWDKKPVRQMTKAIRNLAARAGVADVRIHDFRRTCAVWMLHAGGSLSQVAKMLDDSVKTCERHYAHHDPSYLADAVGRM